MLARSKQKVVVSPQVEQNPSSVILQPTVLSHTPLFSLSHGWCRCLLRLLRHIPPRETILFALSPVTLSKPPARLDKLDHIDHLLCEHDGERGDAENPGDGRVHLIRPDHVRQMTFVCMCEWTDVLTGPSP